MVLVMPESRMIPECPIVMHLNRCIKKGSQEYPEFMTVTTASLSQLALTVVPFHYLPQRAQAIAIGASSLIDLLLLDGMWPLKLNPI